MGRIATNPISGAASGSTDPTKVAKAGDTMTGALVLAADATAALHPVTKQQLDAAVLGTGLDWKASVRLVATSNIASLSGEQTIDSVLTSASDVLLVGQSTASQNGIWTTAAGAWARRSDANDSGEISEGTAVLVTAGTVYAGSQWYCTTTTNPIVPGTTATTWVQTASAAALGTGSVTSTHIADGTIVAGDLSSSLLDTSTDLDGGSASNTKIPSQLAVKTFVDDAIAAIPVDSALAVRATVFQAGGTTYAYDGSGTLITSAATSAANNVTVIQAAINDAAGSYSGTGHGGGGTVVLSDQNYSINAMIELKVGVSLVGLGSFDRNGVTTGLPANHSLYGTTLTPTSAMTSIDVDPSGATLTRTPVVLVGRVGSGGTQSTTNPHAVRIIGINIDCRNKPTAQGILIVDTQFVHVLNCNITGAYSSGGKGIEVYSTISPDDGAHGTRIDGCNIATCYDGIYGSGSGSTDSLITNCRITQYAQDAISLTHGGWQISGCHITSSAGSRYSINCGAPSTIINNYLDTTGNYHLYLDAICTVQGNVIKHGGSSTQKALIFMTSNGYKSSVIGNVAQLGSSQTALVKTNNSTSSLSSNASWRPVIAMNIIGDGGVATIAGAVIDTNDVAIAESSTAMSTTTGSGSNPFIFGNRAHVSAW